MDRRIILECGKVHRVCYTSFLFCKAMWLRLPRFQAEYVLVDGADALDVSFGGDEKAVSEFFEFCRTQSPNGAGVLRFREEKPPEDILPIWEYNSILIVLQREVIIRTQEAWLEIPRKR